MFRGPVLQNFCQGRDISLRKNDFVSRGLSFLQPKVLSQYPIVDLKHPSTGATISRAQLRPDHYNQFYPYVLPDTRDKADKEMVSYVVCSPAPGRAAPIFHSHIFLTVCDNSNQTHCLLNTSDYSLHRS